VKRDLVEFSEHVWSRTAERLAGLGDDEYLWEPAPGCWTIRPDAAGVWRMDQGPVAGDAPFTTMAWRLAHLTACYGHRLNRVWLGLPVDAAPDAFELDAPAPPTAASAIDRLAGAHAAWVEVLATQRDETLAEKLGPVAGEFADADKAAFVLHMLDEFVHHGAEIALLRDLWRARRG
jgi:hypothetical protein